MESKQCVFPFKYEGIQFSSCAQYQGSRKENEDVKYEERHWCSTANDEEGVQKEWGHCDMRTCRNSKNE